MPETFFYDNLSVSAGATLLFSDNLEVSKGAHKFLVDNTNFELNVPDTFKDINTDIRIKFQESISDIDTDIRTIKAVFEDIKTDIRAQFQTDFGDIDTDISVAKLVIKDINTDIRIKFQESISDIDTDIRTIKAVFEDVRADIRISEEFIFDINTDIRAAQSIIKDINLDIRTVFEDIEDISIDIRAIHDPNPNQIQVIKTFFREGQFLSSNTVTIEMEVAGAVKMQFRNENEAIFSPLEPFNSTKVFNLSSGDGTKQVFLRFQDIKGQLSNGNHVIEGIVSTVNSPAVVIEGYDSSLTLNPITESTYQAETTPFFRWQIPIFDIPYEGFSFGMDEEPDDIIDIITPNIVRNGMIVSKKTPLPEMTLETTSGFYYFSSDLKQYSSQEVTLSNGGSLDRIDVIYVSGSLESLNIQQGVESASPTKPEIPADGIELATAFIPAGTTLIADVILTDTRDLFVDLIKFENEPLSIGQHILKVKGIMANGLFSNISEFNIWIANSSPEMGDIKAYTDVSKTIQIFSGIYQTADNTPYLEWTAAPSQPGPIRYHYTIDGLEPTLSSPFTSGTNLNLGPLINGITTIKIKPFDISSGNSGTTKEFFFIFGSTTFTDDTVVIGGSTILKQSLKQIQVQDISWNFDSARTCTIFQPVEFDDNLPFVENQIVTVVFGASNTTVFRGRIKQIERIINISEEGVLYRCVGPRGDLNECYATINDPDFGETAQVNFENTPISNVISTVLSKFPNIVTSIQSFPTGANITDEFVGQTVATVLDSIYERTNFRWYLEPDGTLVSVDLSQSNPGDAKFGIYGTKVSSNSPQFNVMSSNLIFDSTNRYKKAVVEGSRKRLRRTLKATCGATKETLNQLVEKGSDVSELKYKIFTIDSKWPVVKVLETFVSYAKLKSFILIPIVLLNTISQFTIIFLETTIVRKNKGTKRTRKVVRKQSVPKTDSQADNITRDISLPSIGPTLIESFEEIQGTLGPNNTIRFSKAMYNFWPTGVSHNSTGITVTPGVTINTTFGVSSSFWRNPPVKRCASVSADVLIETEPIRVEVQVPGSADPHCILRIVRPEFRYDEDPEDTRDDTSEMIKYATDLLQKSKDIKISGSIVLDTIDLSWNLKKTINLINTQQGSWTSLNAKVVGISYDFNDNTTTLEITNEFFR